MRTPKSPCWAGLLSSAKVLYCRKIIFGKTLKMSLYKLFTQIKDPRRKEGQRTKLPQMFCMITISNLCGYFGGRPIARFAKVHNEIFISELKLKHGTPSHVTFSDILNRVDSKELIQAFNKWASDYVLIEKGDHVSGDGKALASTVSDKHGSGQNFEAVVSMFCQESGLIRAIEQYQNNKESEINVVRFLIKHLSSKGMVFHLDALHTQKKQ